MKNLLRPLGLVFGAIAAAAFVWYAARVLQTQDISRFASPQGFLAIALAGLCYATIIPTSAFAWGGLLRALGEPHPTRSLVEILAISQFAKYIPGNIGAHLGRAGMAAARGIGARAVVASLLMETVLAAAAALMVGAVGIALSDGGAEVLTRGTLGSTLTIVLWILLAVLIAALSFRFAPPAFRERLGVHDAWPEMLRAFATYIGNYVMIGIGMWLMAILLLPDRPHDLGLLAAGFAISWVAGFFAPGAPAGLGIREALMLLVLRTAYPAADALLLVVGMRLVTIIADVVVFLAGNALALSRRHRMASP